MADKLPVKARYAPGSPIDVVALQEFEPTDTISLSLVSGFPAGVTAELANNSISALGDVDTSGSPAPVNGEVLAWNSISGMWEPTVSPGSSAAIWGNITGTLSNQTDLQTALNLKTDQTDFLAHTGDTTIHFTEGSIDHTAIQNIGTNSHAQIDSHIADGTIHFTEASIDHTAILNVGTNSHTQIDTHIADATIHFTESSISHLNIQDIGTNSHTQIDTHIADATIHFSTLEGLSDVTYTGSPTPIDGQVLTWNNIGGYWEPSTPTPGVTDHDLLTNNGGSGSHVVISAHMSDATIHFTEASIDHTAILNVGTNSHAAIDSHIADATIHFTEASISHLNIQDIGTNSHAAIDSHIADGTIHFSVLDGLSDVNAPAPANGEVLTWNNTSSNWEPAAAAGGSDELVKVTATDTTAGYLNDELVAGDNITLTVLNSGANEQLEVKYDKTGMPYIATIGGNDMVVFDDTTRSNKTLSAETQVLYFAESAVSNFDWMQIQHATDADSGYVMPFNGTIVSVAMHCENTNGVAKTINYYFDAVNQGSLASFTGLVNEEVTDTTLNADFAAGTKIRLRGSTGGTIQDTNIQVRIKWRV